MGHGLVLVHSRPLVRSPAALLLSTRAQQSKPPLLHRQVLAQDIAAARAERAPKPGERCAVQELGEQQPDHVDETDCEEQMSRGYEIIEVGDFPLSGCFAKDRILYWGTGETFDKLMDLDAFFQGDGAVEGVFC